MKNIVCSIAVFSLLFMNSVISALEDATEGQCLEPVQCFQDMVEECGMDYAVYYAINSGMDFTQELIKYKDKTEPIIRNMIINPNGFAPRTVGTACFAAYKMGLDDLLDHIQQLAFDDSKETCRFAKEAFVRMCPADRFPVVLKLMETENKTIQLTLIYYALERKIVDPDLLEKWLEDQLEKDKNRKVKLVFGYFKEKVNEAIQSSRESLNHQVTKPAQNESQTIIDTSEKNKTQ